ncbi:PREDICTED: putative transporter SVOPL [Papilio polytes]|uniref:putative transporter SVOPL n=1 Tax=Papilio polytes TaxID=76194 RepID=UPI0006768C73|nr:PREDICTED: putative transporter SVOPL [Papilio polytes]
MGEINVQSLGNTEKNTSAVELKTPTEELDIALKECGFGWFHVLLLLASLIGFVAGQGVSSTTPYILPVAECDLNMDLLQKGFLNAIPFIGMTISSIVAGFLTDTFGRKIFLVYGFGGLFICTLMAGSSQTYLLFASAKFLEGALFGISFNPLMILTSEFCHNGIRDRVVMFQSSFAALGQVIIAIIAWVILSLNWKVTFFDGHFVLHTWNFYIYVMSMWALLSCLFYTFLPESPKYYISQGKFDSAGDVLMKIHKTNMKSDATLTHSELWTRKEVKRERSQSLRSDKVRSFKKNLVMGFYNLKPMFRRPLLYYLILICAMNFLTMLLFNVIRLWYPQLSAIVESFGSNQPRRDLCMMLDTYTEDIKLKSVNLTDLSTCVPTISGKETYINSVILGCVSLIPLVLSGVLVNKVGKKNLFLVAGLISVGCTLGLRWTSSKGTMVALFSSDVAITQAMMSLNQAFTVELFPTTTRTLAISMMMTFGRIGTLVGNVLFPVMLNMGCGISFYTLAGLMICVTALALFLPKKK